MKKTIFAFLLAAASLTAGAQSPIAFKMNALLAAGGIVNAAGEFVISPHSSIQTEMLYSPWKSINKYHFHFGYFMAEYRWHLRPEFNGFYAGANFGMQIFSLSKPYLDGGRLQFENRYSKGCGVMVGLSVGYEKVFRERWIMDAFIGWAYISSYYNGYDRHTDEIDMNPGHHHEKKQPDPWNGSVEWYPNKIGVSLGYIFNKKDKKKTESQKIDFEGM